MFASIVSLKDHFWSLYDSFGHYFRRGGYFLNFILKYKSFLFIPIIWSSKFMEISIRFFDVWYFLWEGKSFFGLPMIPSQFFWDHNVFVVVVIECFRRLLQDCLKSPKESWGTLIGFRWESKRSYLREPSVGILSDCWRFFRSSMWLTLLSYLTRHHFIHDKSRTRITICLSTNS